MSTLNQRSVIFRSWTRKSQHEGEFFGIPGSSKKVYWTGTSSSRR
jgi:hypothetical protein